MGTGKIDDSTMNAWGGYSCSYPVKVDAKWQVQSVQFSEVMNPNSWTDDRQYNTMEVMEKIVALRNAAEAAGMVCVIDIKAEMEIIRKFWSKKP